jgi:hypothetical protein
VVTIFFLLVARETEFNLWGFIFIMLAAVMSGFRWCMTQILLQVCYHTLLSVYILSLVLSVGDWTWYALLILIKLLSTPCFMGLLNLLKKEEYGMHLS